MSYTHYNRVRWKRGIRDDMKTKLVLSGKGIEVNFLPNDNEPSEDVIEDPHLLLRQRVYIELGLNWFKLFNS